MKKKKKQRRKKKGKKTKRKISWSYIFSYGNNLALNILIALFLVGLATLIILYHRQLPLEQKPAEDSAPVDVREVEKIKMDMNQWEKYPAPWYGFELQYPESWEKPEMQDPPAGVDWEYQYSFRKKDPSEMENSCQEKAKKINIANWQLSYLFYKKDAEDNNPYGGFDMFVYDMEKIKGLAKTDEFPAIENGGLNNAILCDQIAESILKNENYPAEKIHILSDDGCHNSIFFYSLAREKYLYNIVPVLKENLGMSANAKRETINNFPEFFSSASSFNLIDIKRPKIVPRKPRITAPKPIAVTRRDALGRMICGKKNDKPGKSNQNKGKHMDMECCFDPDEYPNPWCYYGK